MTDEQPRCEPEALRSRFLARQDHEPGAYVPETQKQLMREAIGTVLGEASLRPVTAYIEIQRSGAACAHVTLRFTIEPDTFEHQSARLENGMWIAYYQFDPYRSRPYLEGSWGADGTFSALALGTPEGLVFPHKGPFWGRPIDYFRMRDADRTGSGYEVRLEPLVAGVSESVLVIDDRLERVVSLTSADEEIRVTYDFNAGYMPLPLARSTPDHVVRAGFRN